MDAIEPDVEAEIQVTDMSDILDECVIPSQRHLFVEEQFRQRVARLFSQLFRQFGPSLYTAGYMHATDDNAKIIGVMAEKKASAENLIAFAKALLSLLLGAIARNPNLSSDMRSVFLTVAQNASKTPGELGTMEKFALSCGTDSAMKAALRTLNKATDLTEEVDTSEESISQ